MTKTILVCLLVVLAVPAAAGWLGYCDTTAHARQEALSDEYYATKFSNGAGVVSEIKGYLRRASDTTGVVKGRFVVLEDAGGSPGALLGRTEEVTVNGWGWYAGTCGVEVEGAFQLADDCPRVPLFHRRG